MQHVIVIRSAYGPDVPLEVNRQRLRITAATCVPSLAMQTCRDFSLELRVNWNDPLLDQRLESFRSTGLSVSAVGNHERRVQTRMDDDDALARDFVERVQSTRNHWLEDGENPQWLTFPNGMVCSAQGWAPKRQVNNQFITRVSSSSVMELQHGQVTGHAIIDEKPAWLWVRHQHARSGGKRPKVSRPLTELTEWFGISPEALYEAIR